MERDDFRIHLPELSFHIYSYLVVTRRPEACLPSGREDAVSIEVIHRYLELSVRPNNVRVDDFDVSNGTRFDHNRIAYLGIVFV